MKEELCTYFYRGCKSRKSLVCVYREYYVKCETYYELQRQQAQAQGLEKEVDRIEDD